MIRRNTPIPPADALARLEEICARSEQCTHEALTRLAGWGIAPETAQKIIRRLKASKFIDDGRYARAFARDKVVYNRWGAIKIRHALALKRLEADMITDALAEVTEEEYATALTEVLRAKARAMERPLNFADSGKLLRHAASRGFEPALVIDFLKHPDRWDY